MRNWQPTSQSEYNNSGYFIHSTGEGYRSKYYVLDEDRVLKSEFFNHVIVKCESYEKCKEWIAKQIEKGNKPKRRN